MGGSVDFPGVTTPAWHGTHWPLSFGSARCWSWLKRISLGFGVEHGHHLVRIVPMTAAADLTFGQLVRAILSRNGVAARTAQARGLAGFSAFQLGQMHRMRKARFGAIAARRQDRGDEDGEHEPARVHGSPRVEKSNA
jgi:hypothetical protein